MQFLFPPERPFIGGNHKNKLGRPRRNRKGTLISSTYTTEAAKNQAEYFAGVAVATVLLERWEIPDYARMDMLAINIDCDRDGISKTLADAMEGIVYSNDRRIKAGDITLMRAKGPARVIVAIQAVHGQAFGYPRPSKRKKEP
jgi:Holliday junction resolvase RusA-like endonuclease